jgi:hypothetical protein
MWVYFAETCVSAWKRGWGSSLLNTTSHHIAFIDYGSSDGVNPVIKCCIEYCERNLLYDGLLFPVIMNI